MLAATLKPKRPHIVPANWARALGPAYTTLLPLRLARAPEPPAALAVNVNIYT